MLAPMLAPRRLIGLVVLCLLGVSACGASARERTIRTAFTVTNAARDGFIAWDHERQLVIVAEATSYADGATKLEAYRTLRGRVVEAFEAAYRTIAAAAVVNGSRDLVAIGQAVALLKAALVDLGVTKP